MRSKKEIQGQYVVQLGPRGSYQGEQIKYWHNGLFYFCYLLDSKYESSSTITPYIWISIHQQPYWLQGWIFEIVVHIAYKPRISFLQVCKNELAHCLHELVKYTIKAANGAKLRFCTRRFCQDLVTEWMMFVNVLERNVVNLQHFATLEALQFALSHILALSVWTYEQM